MRKSRYAVIALVIYLTTTFAFASATNRKVELENQLRDRVMDVVEKVQSVAFVQVQVNLKKVSSTLPGMGFDAQVVPMENDGELGASSISSIQIRIVTQDAEPPEWVKTEVKKAVDLGGVNIEIKYEKVAGTVRSTKNEVAEYLKDDFAKTFKSTTDVAVDGIKHLKIGLWGLIVGVVISLAAVAFGIFSFARKLEVSLARVVEEKIVPAMQANRGGAGGGSVREKREESSTKAAIAQAAPSASGGKELADLPVETLVTLFSDCYWTHADGYAHYLWSQMSQAQREKVLASPDVDRQYFSYIRQFSPENLNYHLDARYLMLGRDFRTSNQEDLAAWLRKNKKDYWRITPLRWDLLPLSLAERIQFAQSAATPSLSDVAPVAISQKSKARDLPSKLEVRALSPADEDYIWSNSDAIPKAVRPSLKTLVWLAQAPLEHRKTILADLDARQLAEAWTGPEAALAKLKEALPPKKIEMLEHFIKDTQPDREGDVFSYLVESGLTVPGAEESQSKAAA